MMRCGPQGQARNGLLVIFRFIHDASGITKCTWNLLEPTAGLEPATYALRMRCSTD